MITVLPIGGVAPYTYSIDGTVFHASPVFTGLDEGIYQITSLDANDCSTTEIIAIGGEYIWNVDFVFCIDEDGHAVSVGATINGGH